MTHLPPTDRAPSSAMRSALAACRGPLLLLLGFSAALNVISFAGPIFSLQVFDRVLNGRSETTLVLLAALTIFLVLLGGFLDWVRSRLLLRVGLRFDAAVAGRLFDAAAFRRAEMRPGAAPGSLVRDLDAVRDALSGAPAVALLDLPFVPLYLAACFLIHPWLGWTSLALGALLLAVAVLGDLATGRPGRRADAASILAAERFAAAVRHGETIAALGMAGTVRRRWRADRDASLGWSARSGDRARITAALSRILRFATPVAATGVGAYLAIRGEITPGALIAASLIAARALQPLDGLVACWRGLAAARGAWSRLREVDTADPPRRTALPRPMGRLEVSRLVVVPPGAALPALRGVSVSLAPGEVLGVVGASGSGKSSLVRALVGAWQPLAGEVRLDGADIRNWDRAALGEVLGYLPQDASLMEGTIAENIARLRTDATDESVVRAAMRAGAHDMIQRLPAGYDTPLRDGGANLSGGQRQRIALARALFGDPALLVLDEPNASLDAEGEAALLAAIRAEKERGATVVLTTHRSGLLTVADRILVLDGGAVRACGPREGIAFTGNGASAREPAPRPALVMAGGERP